MTGWDPINRSAHGLHKTYSPLKHISLVCQTARIAPALHYTEKYLFFNVFTLLLHLILYHLFYKILLLLLFLLLLLLIKNFEHRCRPFAGQIVTSRNKSS